MSRKNRKTSQFIRTQKKLRKSSSGGKDQSQRSNNTHSYFYLIAFIPIAICLLQIFVIYTPRFVDKEIFATSCELARMYNFTCEEYEVTTEDGYILKLHRIGKNKTGEHQIDERSLNRKVALVVHCLECDSSVFLCNTAENSLGFLLADNDIDVWLINLRGTSYSHKHVNYSTYNSKYWDFSWQEMAKYDLPATVDFILAKTQHDRITYIGQSQGSIVGLAQMAESSDFQAKIDRAYMLSPTVTLKNMQSPVTGLLEFIHKYVTWPKNGLFLPRFVRQLINTASATYCSKDVFGLCLNTYRQFSGNSSEINMDATRIPIFFTHALSGTSIKNIRHYAQLHLSKLPTYYDYGNEQENEQAYGTKAPPIVNLTNIQTPVAIFAGQNDWLVSDEDINYLIENLPNVFYFSNSSDFAHLDFIFGTRATELVYDVIVDDIKKRD